MTGLILKLIAVVSMLIDHTGYVLFPGQISLRIVGRLAFPIYCFLLVEGFLNTKNLKAYMFRLLGFALVSEIPFDLAFYDEVFYPDYQNVFWTLLFGLMAISLMSLIKIEKPVIRAVLRLAVAVPFGVVAQLIHTDYRWIGVGIISVMYVFHDLEAVRDLCCAVMMLPIFTNQIEFFGLISLIPVHFYNGKRGYLKGAWGYMMQWAFYLFYPVHLLVLHFIWLRV